MTKWKVSGSFILKEKSLPRVRIDHFTVVAKLPGLTMEARLPVTLF